MKAPFSGPYHLRHGVSLILALGVAVLASWPPAVNVQAAAENGALAASFKEAEDRLEAARQVWHVSPLTAAALSSDGALALTGGVDRSIRLSNARSGKSIHRLEGHESTILALAFSSDARRAASGSSDRTVRLWDLEKGKSLQHFHGHTDAVGCVSCSSDGRLVASGSPDGSVRLWDGETGKSLHVLAQKAPITALAFAPGGKLLASGGADGSLCTWDVQNGKQLRRQAEHGDEVQALAFDEAGERLISVGGAVKYDVKQKQFNPGDSAVRVWNAGTGKLVKTVPVEGLLPMAAAFASEGRQINLAGLHIQTARGGEVPEPLKVGLTLVSGGVGGFLYLSRLPASVFRSPMAVCIEAESGKRVRTGQVEHRLGSAPTALSADGRLALSGWSLDNRAALWDPESGKPQRWLGPDKVLPMAGPRSRLTVLCLAASADGKRVIGGGTDKALYLWDADSGSPMLKVGEHAHPLSCAALSPSGKFALSAAGWNNDENSNPAFAFYKKAKDPKGPKGSVHPVILEADGRPDSRLRLWDVEQMAEVVALEGHTGRINQVVFSPDGSLAASASADQTVCIWDIGKQRLLHRCGGHKARVNTVAFSPDGKRVASGGGDKMVRIWDTTTGKEVSRCTGHGHAVWAVVFSPDGQTVASAGGELDNAKADVRIVLWDAATGKKLREMPGHPSPVIRLAFDANGSRLYSLAQQELKVWEPPSSQMKMTDVFFFVSAGAASSFARRKCGSPSAARLALPT